MELYSRGRVNYTRNRVECGGAYQSAHYYSHPYGSYQQPHYPQQQYQQQYQQPQQPIVVHQAQCQGKIFRMGLRCSWWRVCWTICCWW